MAGLGAPAHRMRGRLREPPRAAAAALRGLPARKAAARGPSGGAAGACRRPVLQLAISSETKAEWPDWTWAASCRDGHAGPAPVRSFAPNAWGLHDTEGNVQEWCWDWYVDKYHAADLLNPAGPPRGVHRVNRWGPWDNWPTWARSAYRGRNTPPNAYNGLGLRLVRLASPA
jgi:formylglycine-generating enzyme required for sulfatase activity